MNTKYKKISIIGVGYVGASIAYALAIKNVASKIVLIDQNNIKAQGEAEDIRHGIGAMGTPDLQAGTFEDCVNSDLIIVTAGRNRKPGEIRLALAQDNVKILENVLEKIKDYCQDAVVLIVANPIDILVQKAAEILQLPNGRVFGTGCILDSSRLVRCIADYTGVSTTNINGFIVGEHGEAQVVVWSTVTVAGIPIAEYAESMNLEWNEDIRKSIAKKVCGMGAEIISAKERTHYGIATCVCYLAEAILSGNAIITSVCSPLKGEHGVLDVSLSVPSVVGANGVEKRIRQKWKPEEYRGFFDSVENVRKVLNNLNENR